MVTIPSDPATAVVPADVLPSTIFNSVAVEVTPSNMFNSATVDVMPSKALISAAVAVTDSPAISAPLNSQHQVTFLPFNDIDALEKELAKET